MGGRIYEFPVFTTRSLPKILNLIDVFLFEHKNEYSTIHCHMANAACFYFWKAKKYGIKNLFLHSHNSASSGVLSHTIRNYPLLKLGNFMATDRFACTDLAGQFLFGNKKYNIIKNAIEVERFKFKSDIRDALRIKNAWHNKIILGHIGRLSPKKNQLFLLDIFSELRKLDGRYHLVFIGQGEDEKQIINRAKELEIYCDITILPPCDNIEDYYQAFDIFVFPSLYEGLGIVLIEAQCSGLPIFASSDRIPYDVKMTDCIKFLSLKKSSVEWAKFIHNDKLLNRKSRLAAVRMAGYDINIEVSKLASIYLKERNLLCCTPPARLAFLPKRRILLAA